MSRTVVFALGVMTFTACVPTALPSRYVLASTPLSASSAPESRVFVPRTATSPPLWSSAGLAPSPAINGIPPGIGARTGDPTTSQYLLAWFGPGGVLHTATSKGGVSWTGDSTHGSFQVDQHSRPAVVFNYDSFAWFVAFRQSNDTVAVLRVAPTDSPPVIVQSVNTAHAPSLAFWNHQMILVYRRGSIFVIKSSDGLSWPAGPGVAALGPGGTPLVTEDRAPCLNSVLGQLQLTTTKLVAVPGPDGLTHGEIDVWTSADGINWNSLATLSPTNPFAEGSALAGPSSALLVAEAKAGASATSAYFFDGANARTTINTHQVEAVGPTQTQLDVSLAFGAAPAGEVKKITLTFQEFKRGFLRGEGPDFGTEDVTLRAQHLGPTGSVISEMTPFTLHGATKDQAHFFNEEGHPFPTLSALMRDGDTMLVSLSVSDANVHTSLSFASLATGPGTSHWTLDQPPTGRSYELWLGASAQEP